MLFDSNAAFDMFSAEIARKVFGSVAVPEITCIMCCCCMTGGVIRAL